MKLADDHGTTYTGKPWPKRITLAKKLAHLQAAAVRETFMTNFFQETHGAADDIAYFSRRSAMFKRRARQMEAG